MQNQRRATFSWPTLHKYMRSEFIVTSCSLGKLRYTVLISALCVDNRMSDNDFLLTAYLSVVDVILSVTLRPGRRNVA